jgi:hypothetical protein
MIRFELLAKSDSCFFAHCGFLQSANHGIEGEVWIVCACEPNHKYVCMYVCMYVSKSPLVSLILHSLAGTVEIVDWHAQGQDCSHRERGQSSFDMSLAW